MFYASENVTTGKEVKPCAAPWDFKITTNISAQIRGDKETRQAWYRHADTRHHFYTAFEGVNPLMRVSQENPPHALHGIVADYDTKLSDERIAEAIASMAIKPSYVETSLGGYRRLVWLFVRSLILAGDNAFAVFVLQQAASWLKLDVLPALDEKAQESPSRLYANGGVWVATGHPPVSEKQLQAFFVRCGKKFAFKAGDSAQIPFDLVEKAIKEKFDNFSWPGDFVVGSQGPTFWIPESTSPTSAIVKEGGIFTFAAHADKSFYSWADLLGKEFVADFKEQSISQATSGIYFDGKNYWRRLPTGGYEDMDNKGMDLHCESAGLSHKADSSGMTPINQAHYHVRSRQRVKGVGPFSMRPSGLITMDTAQYINTYDKRAVQPSALTETWGTNFPHIATHLDWVFDPNGAEQLEHYLCWHKLIYTAALKQDPQQFQNVVFRGGPGIGKTWLGREVVGVSLGGFIDASDFIVKGESFNAHYFEYPLWTLDDDSPTDGSHAVKQIHSRLKKFAANNEFTANQKFLRACKLTWSGAIWVTTNLDFSSGRIVQFEDGANDKLNLYSGRAEVGDFQFADRNHMTGIRDLELPHYLQFLLDYKIPEKWEDKKRWGIRAFQDFSLSNQSRQSSPSALFKELLIGALHEYFNAHPEAKEWRGAISRLYTLLHSNPLLHEVMRSLKIEQANRHLEVIDREGSLRVTASTGDWNIRIWTFYRDSVMNTPEQPLQTTKELTPGNFQAPTQNDVAH